MGLEKCHTLLPELPAPQLYNMLIVVIYYIFPFIFFLGRGGWKSKTVQPQKNKINMNILRQEKLIAQKKKEIEAKMAQQAKMNVQTTSKPLPQR